MLIFLIDHGVLTTMAYVESETDYSTMKGRWKKGQHDKQAQAIRQWRPWDASTGPVTVEGRAKTRMNALTHGTLNREANALRNAVTALLADMDCSSS